MQTDPDLLDDVLKVDGKPDDCYDGCTYGLFGQLGDRKKPQAQIDREFIESIEDPFQKRLAQYKITMNRERKLQAENEDWRTRI